MGNSKMDLPLSDGRTMIEHVIAALEEVCNGVVVVGGAERNLRVVPDLREAAGPLGGIEALLSSGIDTEYLMCPGDIPLASSDLLRRLTVPTEAAATIFEAEGDPVHSLPLRISRGALDTVTAALDAGRNAVHSLLSELEVERVSITGDEAAQLRNVNTPDDYASI